MKQCGRRVKLLNDKELSTEEFEQALATYLTKGWTVIGFSGPGGSGYPNCHVLLTHANSDEG